MDGGSARCKDFVQHKILPNKRIQKVSCLFKVNEQCLSYPPSSTIPSVLPLALFSINTESLPKPKTVLISRIENNLVFGRSIARLTQTPQAAAFSKLILTNTILSGREQLFRVFKNRHFPSMLLPVIASFNFNFSNHTGSEKLEYFLYYILGMDWCVSVFKAICYNLYLIKCAMSHFKGRGNAAITHIWSLCFVHTST